MHREAKMTGAGHCWAGGCGPSEAGCRDAESPGGVLCISLLPLSSPAPADGARAIIVP